MLSDLPMHSGKKRRRTLETLDLRSSLSSQSDTHSPFLLSPTFLHTTDPLLINRFPNPHQPSTFSIQKRRCHPLPIKSQTRHQSTPTTSSSSSLSHPLNLSPCHICHRRPTAHADLPGYSSCESCERRTCYVCIRVCEGEGCRSSSISGNSGGDKDFEYYHASQGQRGQNHARDGNGNENPFTRGKSICSKCCVEVGTEGKVWCLVCFEGDADENTRGGGDSGDEELENETGRVEEWLDSFTE